RTLCGPKHPSTVGTMHLLAFHCTNAGRLQESLGLHEQALEGFRGLGVPDTDPSAIWCMLTYAQVCQQAGKLDRADQLLREALELCRKHENSQMRRNGTANTLGWLALNLSLQQRYDEAEPLAREAVAMNQDYEPRRFYWRSVLGAILVGQQKFEEAEPLLLKGYEGIKEREATLRGDERYRLIEARERLVRYYEITNQPEKAREWRQKVEEDKNKK